MSPNLPVNSNLPCLQGQRKWIASACEKLECSACRTRLPAAEERKLCRIATAAAKVWKYKFRIPEHKGEVIVVLVHHRYGCHEKVPAFVMASAEPDGRKCGRRGNAQDPLERKWQGLQTGNLVQEFCDLTTGGNVERSMQTGGCSAERRQIQGHPNGHH